MENHPANGELVKVAVENRVVAFKETIISSRATICAK